MDDSQIHRQHRGSLRQVAEGCGVADEFQCILENQSCNCYSWVGGRALIADEAAFPL